MTSLLLAIVLTYKIEPEYVIQEHIDLIEINRVYTRDTGEARLHQYIFWEFSYYLSDFRVIDWRRYENVKINPRYDHKQKKWFLRWWDKKDKVIREIWATSFVETKTYVDREVQNHKIWPKEFQRGLLKRRRK
jgi:hypothetical protein